MSNWLAGAARSFAICALYPLWALTALLSIPLTLLLGADLAAADRLRRAIDALSSR